MPGASARSIASGRGSADGETSTLCRSSCGCFTAAARRWASPCTCRSARSDDGTLSETVHRLSLPNRPSRSEIEERGTAKAIERRPVSPQPPDVFDQRLVLLGLGDVQVVDRDAADHVAIVRHLEPFGGDAVRLRHEQRGAAGLCECERGEAGVVRELVQGGRREVGDTLAVGLRRLHPFVTAAPLPQRNLYREREAPSLEQVLICEARLRGRGVESVTGLDRGTGARTKPRLS